MSLGQLLDSEKAAAESALKAAEQSWQTRLSESAAAAASDAKAAAEEEARAVQTALQQQLDEACATREVNPSLCGCLLVVSAGFIQLAEYCFDCYAVCPSLIRTGITPAMQSHDMGPI